MDEYTVIVAFGVRAPSRTEALHLIAGSLSAPRHGDRIYEWWMAEDDRIDGSDNDSAVFVHPGNQRAAIDLLVSRQLTHRYNHPDSGPDPANPSIFEENRS